MTKQLFQWAKQARGILTLTIGIGVLGTVVMIAQMTFLSKSVNQVFLLHKSPGQVALLLFLLLATIIVRAGLVWLREVTAQRIAIYVKSVLRERVFAHLFALGPMYSKGERTGELVALVGEGIERLDAYFSRYLPQVMLSVIVPLLIIVYIWPLDWLSAALLLLTGPVIPLLMILVGSYTEEHIQRQWLALSRMSAHFLDAVQGLPTLKIFGYSAEERQQVTTVSNGFRDKTLKVLRFAFLSGMVLEFLAAIAIGLVAVMLGIRLLNGGIAFEQAFLILLLTPEFYHPLRELGVQRHAGMEGKAAAQRIVEILSTPASSTGNTEDSTPATPYVRARSTPATPYSHTRIGRATDDHDKPPSLCETHSMCPQREIKIEFTNVTYTYPQPANDRDKPQSLRGVVNKTEAQPTAEQRPALKAINLTLAPHTRTALVGRSGAGKSTLVNVLMRFIEPQSGTVMMNGVPLAEMSVEAWREHVALVPQRPYLFYGSISANIRLARPTASDEEVQRAAELAGAAEFINSFPQRYATEIGEQGTRLSAGQAQRIAIARAFLKDAPLLILDEPTSSLDPRSETIIRQALEQLMRDRTTLVVAHRLNTIATMEQIVVLEDGQIVEIGQHAALLQQHGPYAHLMSIHGKGAIPL